METDLNELPLASRDALRMAALLGDSFALPDWAAIGASVDAQDALFDSGALAPEGNTKAKFVSEELREEVLSGLPWSQKRRLSEKIVEVLERRKGEPEEIATHCLHAQNFEKARGYLVKGAEKRCLNNEYKQALNLLKQAFELWPADDESDLRRTLLRELARCAVNTNDADARRLAWEELLDMAEGSGDLKLSIEANRELADVASAVPDRHEARERLKRAAALSSALGDAETEARQWQAYAQFLSDNIRLRDSMEASAKALVAAEKAGVAALQSEILALNAVTHAMTGKSEEAFERVERAIKIALDSELPEQLAMAYRRKANVLEYSCDYVGYRDLELDSLGRCQSEGHENLEQACWSCVAYAFFRLGQWKRSSDALKEALERMQVEGELKAFAVSVKACLALFRGERKQGEALSEEGLRLIGQYGGIVIEFFVHWALGLLKSFDSDQAKASESYRSLIALWRETEDRKDAVPGIMSAASFFADTNAPTELSECIDILSLIAREHPTLEKKAARDAAIAEESWMQGRAEEARGLMAQSLAGYRVQGLKIEIALVSRRLGLISASMGEVKAAEEAWTESADIARELGMRPLLDVLERERSSTGTKQAESNLAEGAGLTKRQLEVLRLVAKGSTNKEAAAALGLSPRTVEMHVASVLERLNCRARTDAIRKAVELGLV